MPICPKLESNGFCDDPSCLLQHNFQECTDCGVVLTSNTAFKAHMNGKRHAKTMKRIRIKILRCAICDRHISSDQWDAHVSGSSHLRMVEDSGLRGAGLGSVVEPESVIDAGYRHCTFCEMQVSNQNWFHHQTSRRHQLKQRYTAFRAALDDAEKDKHGVTVTGDGDFGIIETAVASQQHSKRFTVQTSIPHSNVVVASVSLASAKNNSRTVSSGFNVQASPTEQRIVFGRSITVSVSFQESNIGRYDDRLEIVCRDVQLVKQFAITRPLKATIGSKEDYELLKPKAPYKPRPRISRPQETDIVSGPPPKSTRVIPYVSQLPKAPIPQGLASVLSSGKLNEIISSVRQSFLPGAFTADTYARHFKTLLWIEEFRMEHDLEIYDIPNATLTRHGRYYYLDVPGLAEKRPSVLTGDIIHVQKHGDPAGKWYEGHVHVVRRAEVGLCFHQSFDNSSSAQNTVRFKLNRIPLRRQHQAMDTVFTQDRVLLPNQGHLRSKAPSPNAADVNIFNAAIAKNRPQLQAVVSIVEQYPGSPPFVVFGPPGTGKTVTIVEAIRQILQKNPSARILACAPSNSAADLIAERLLSLGTDELFRFYAPSRFKDTVPDCLNSYTYMSDGHFSVPPMAIMNRFKVIVSTCVSAGMPHGIGMRRGHFTHVFVDEAGQATEPEVMIPIKTMADNSTNVVLSGDHKQLGPIIRSAVARSLGLETSYLERLMERDVYNTVRGHGVSLVKLVKNFRSHPSILKFSNERFYGGDLQPCGDPKVINAYINCALLAKKGFPIIFHAMAGKDDREASSPSFFNIDEVTQVKDYVVKLKVDRRCRTTDKDIGIIAPYHAQVLKIRTGLRSVAEDIKVGSVEEFQGQERRVIIISTVRSSREFVEYDLKHTLGFVANPRRFNVSVTRAQALLIIVGDPDVLSLDPLWRSFLNYVYINGGWKGLPISWDPQAPVVDSGYDSAIRDAGLADMNDFTRRMEAMTLTNVAPQDGDGDQEAEANVDRPWQEPE